MRRKQRESCVSLQPAAKQQWLENLINERLEPPDEVRLFGEFEELCKLYTIEPPYLSRSQIELMFDVYDASKSSQIGLLDYDDEQDDDGAGDTRAIGGLNHAGQQNSADQEQAGSLGQRASTAGAAGSGAGRASFGAGQRRKWPSGRKSNFSWCKLLFSHNAKRLRANCCLSTSDTRQEFFLSPSSSTGSGGFGTSGQQQQQQQQYSNGGSNGISSGETIGVLSPDLDDDQEDAEMKAEVRQMIGPLLSQLRRSSALSDSTRLELAAQNELEQQQQVILDASIDSNNMSVCLFDKRQRVVRLKCGAENGRRLAQCQTRLQELRMKLRSAYRKFALQSFGGGQQQHNSPSVMPTQLPRSFELKLENYFEAKIRAPLSKSNKKCSYSETLSKTQLEQLVSLTKESLNHLIDAQLLLRNKLTSEQQQQQQARGNEYEILLKNNFNLLKIWQNLEETKRLVCFVCEPIKTNLNDLFWFSRHRSAELQQCSSFDECLLASPSVCLDSIQVKRGLLQVLEALNYLHSICKLIHRNVTPKNILVAANDNWKLAGLEFAIRFESATISESASIMAHEGSCSLLRYSSGAGAKAALRRQRSLHQTKCEEFPRRKPKDSSILLQPEVDYLAPEIWKSAKCSHKSDLFSFGLILSQTYDLCRHKPPISCKKNVLSYESELKKLTERRKRKLGRLVPFEMRTVLMEMLDIEPNFRPSANYALQLFRRPIELCKANEDSLRHLRSSLSYLDTRCLNGHGSGGAGIGANNNTAGGGVAGTAAAAATSSAGTGAANINNLNCVGATVGAASATAGGATPLPAASGAHKKRINYFRKVTSQANRSQGRKQTRNLHLLNLLLLGVDSLANNNGSAHLAADYAAAAQVAAAASTIANHANAGGQFQLQQQQQQQQALAFPLLRLQFEHTFESLRLLYKSSKTSTDLTGCGALTCPPDSRTLLLIVALHRRLLDQVALMRVELPPVCRLTAANTQANRPTKNHRVLAELEDKLHCLVSRHSLARMAPVLADPLLKLDEFLLVYELVNDLLAFVGQKCRQSFIQRGKQLLNELTPVTGCPSLSSSDEEDSIAHPDLCASVGVANSAASLLGATSRLLGSSRETLNNNSIMSVSNNNLSGLGQTTSGGGGAASSISPTGRGGRMSAHRYSEYSDSTAIQQSFRRQQQAQSRQQQPSMPTKISITAPSPMGSMREVNRMSAESQTLETQLVYQQRRQQQQQQFEQGEQMMIERTGELSLGTSPANETDEVGGDVETLQSSVGSLRRQHHNQQQHEASGSGSQDGGADQVGTEKSRSQLIDELLRTINDDSFNDFVDFNNKFAAQAGGGTVSGGNSQQHLASLNAINNQSRRPRSAIDPPSARAGFQQQGASYSPGRQQQAGVNSGQRPSSLALNQQQPNRSGFDNVIRRMSTNFVQNFNKMSAQTLSTIDTQQDSNGLRREKSSTCANSLYVDNQVPARRHSDNTINIPRIQVALSSPQSSNTRPSLNQRASISATKLANKWKLSARNQRESGDKLSPNLSGALGYMRRHSSGNTTDNDQAQSNGQTGSHLLLNASPFKTKSSSNLGIDFLLSNRSMKRRYSAASMLGHQTQRKAEDLIDAGMKSVQNMFS